MVPQEAGALLGSVELERQTDRALLRALLDWQDTGNYDYEMFRETLAGEVLARADSLRSADSPLPGDGRISLAVELHLARIEEFRVLAKLERGVQIESELSPEDRKRALEQFAALHQERHELDRRLDTLSQMVSQSSRHSSE